MNKKAQTGFIIRVIAGVVDVISLPFLIVNPMNVYAQIGFGFGNFLLILGGLAE
ncbi:MAG: hypothetical protein KKB21_00540 [Nanoarchaeota archaeon]|nr:hypothetical protein [Nanoarchaeota archaeon]MBU4086042.1 hypothetical protein [Nanoarchaeota archaeon]